MVKVRGAGGGRVSIAGVACYRPGDRPHLFYQSGCTAAGLDGLVRIIKRTLKKIQYRPRQIGRASCRERVFRTV